MRTAIYGLKRTFGKPATVCCEIQSVDRESGSIERDVEELEISHLIILPLRHTWENGVLTFKRNVAYQQGDREFLLDSRDIDFQFSMKHYIMYNNNRYNTIAFDVYDECIYIVGRNESQLA